MMLPFEIAIDGMISKKAQRKLKDQGMQGNYRYCYIDMDTGDVIYLQTTPNP